MCCSGFLKMIMFVFNGIIFLAGSAILGVGIWVQVDSSSLLGVLDQVEDAPPELAHLASVGYLLIAVGGVLLIMGFLGCCGAIRESKCMLLTFFIIVLIIFIAEVAGAIVILIFQPLVKTVLDELAVKVGESIKKNYGGDNDFTDIWDITMKELECCGYHNHTEFDGSPFQNSSMVYPIACCRNVTNDVCTLTATLSANVPGCFDTLVRLIEDNAVILGAVALGIAALEIAAMVVSMILYKKIDK